MDDLRCSLLLCHSLCVCDNMSLFLRTISIATKYTLKGIKTGITQKPGYFIKERDLHIKVFNISSQLYGIVISLK